MRLMLLTVLTTAAFVSAGCVPFPHTVTLSPPISGTVVAQGQPVEGATVLLGTGAGNRPCEHIIQSVTTQVDGAFLIEGRTELRFLYAPLVAPLSVSGFTVCVSVKGEAVMGHQGFVLQSRSDKVVLRCNIDHRKPYLGPDGYRGEAVCAMVEPEKSTPNRPLTATPPST